MRGFSCSAGDQEIRLGRRDIDERLYRFFDVVAPALANELKRVAYVDLRYTNGFAVGWRDTSIRRSHGGGASPGSRLGHE